MNIRDKVFLDREGLTKEGPINIVVFGDSVTHGALLTDNNYETVYHNLLKQKINRKFNYVPVNIINAGIGGITAKESLDRVDSQVISHSPDLVIVCFGLNDVNGSLEEYLSSLRIIFEKCIKSDIEVIFMTPNMLNTYVAEDAPEQYRDYAAVTAEYQNGGRMDLYMSEAVKLAKETGVTVCDCYAEWKKLSETEDTTMLLINRINHPVPKMHELFAEKLYDLIFNNTQISETEAPSTMYKK